MTTSFPSTEDEEVKWKNSSDSEGAQLSIRRVKHRWGRARVDCIRGRNGGLQRLEGVVVPARRRVRGHAAGGVDGGLRVCSQSCNIDHDAF